MKVSPSVVQKMAVFMCGPEKKQKSLQNWASQARLVKEFKKRENLKNKGLTRIKSMSKQCSTASEGTPRL